MAYASLALTGSVNGGRARAALTFCALLLALVASAAAARAQSFSAPVSYTLGQNPNSAVAGDFNGDGKPDLAVTVYNDDGVSVLINNGDGTFKPPVVYPTDLHAGTITSGDFNQDGKLDLAVGNFDGGNLGQGTVSILLGKGDGTFQAAVNYAVERPGSPHTGDFNGDGALDIVALVGTAAKVSVLIGNGDGTFHPAATYATGAQPSDLTVADFNGDAKLDLVTSTQFGEASLLRGNGNGTFQAATYIPNSSGATGVAAGDMNADGKQDIVFANGPSAVFLGNGDGTFKTPTACPFGENPSTPVLADFNGDGKLDAAAGNFYSATVTVLRGNGDGTVQAPAAYPAKPNPSFLVVSDLNADGKPDLAVVSNGTHRVNVLLNSPSPRGVTVTATATVAATGVLVATFTDFDTSKTAASFTATIDWGDATASTSGTVAANGTGGFNVTGSHTYAKEGSYTVTVRIADANGNFATATSTAVVADAPLTASGQNISVVRRATFSGVVATFTDADPTSPLSEYSATINWGDGTSTAATIVSKGGGNFDVTGTHAYASAGTFTVGVSITTLGGSTASASSTATVTNLTLGGHVLKFDGTPLSGVTVTLTGPDSGSVSTAADGSYSFAVGAGGPYTLTPSKTNFVFTPASLTFTDLAADQTADFSSTRPSVQFSLSGYGAGEGDGSALITVTRAGDAADAAAVDFATSDGTGNGKSDYTTALGTLSFGVGETSKSFRVLITENGFATGSRTVNLMLSNASGATLGAQATAVLTISDNDAAPSSSNPIDAAEFFVRQHYADFLNREPDASGFQFWVGQLAECGTDGGCTDVKRTNVSQAFFLSTEFQKTGYRVIRVFKATFTDSPQRPRGLPRYREFLRDTQGLQRGVVVGEGDWEQQLAANLTDYARRWVQSADFVAEFPEAMAAQAYVDKLFQNSEVTPTTAERDAAVAAFGAGGVEGRAAALLSVTDSGSVYNRQYNPAAVLMQYFGYLRRNPPDAPEATLDFQGYDFWLQKLNNHSLPGEDMRDEETARNRLLRAEMVRSFLISGEYRARFGNP